MSFGDEEWDGVDFDGTLAVHEPGSGAAALGRPIPAMVEYVKDLIASGIKVKIMTARVSSPDSRHNLRQETAIRQWCLTHLGTELEVTCKKDYMMRNLYDDRAFHVVPNTGRIIRP